MLRRLILLTSAAVLVSGPAQAAIWPEEFFGLKRVSLTLVRPEPDPVWEEYGLEQAETAEFEGNGVRMKATAWRFVDPTAAMAAYQWRRPPGYQPADIVPLSVESRDGLFLAHGNYVFHFEGKKPTVEELVGLYLVLPRLDTSALPILPTYLPEAGRLEGSERFILGPESLRKFEPRIPASVAAFQYAPEAQLAKYKTDLGEMSLAIFSYPTPQIARERLEAFRALPGALVKRSGPFIVVLFDTADAEAAQQLLAKVNYRATIVWEEATRSEAEKLADLLLTVGALVGLLLVTALVIGLVIGGGRFLYFGRKGAEKEDPMILLHLEDR